MSPSWRRFRSRRSRTDAGSQTLGPEDPAAGDADVGGSAKERTHGRRSAPKIPLELDARLELAELILPDLRQATVGQVVVSPDANDAGNLFLGLVVGKIAQVELVGRVELFGSSLLNELRARPLKLERILAAAGQALRGRPRRT